MSPMNLSVPEMDGDSSQMGSMEHGVFHRCIQEDNVEGLKLTVGAMERTLYENEKTFQETLERLETKVDALTEKIENNDLTIGVTTNGIQANVKLQSIVQYILDRPGTHLKKMESGLNRIIATAKDVIWVFGAILILLYTVQRLMTVLKPL
jgi:hypothetical protein